MGVTLTDVLLFGKAQSDDVDNATLVIYRRNILRWSALGGYLDVIVKGVSPLSLPDAIANSLSYVKAFGGTEQRNLPLGYTQFGRIHFDGNCYFDTGIVINSYTATVKLIAAFASQTTTSPCMMWGYMGGTGNLPRWGTGLYQNSYLMSANTTAAVGNADTNKHIFTSELYLDNGTSYWKTTIDDTFERAFLTANPETLLTNTLSLYIGARHNNGTAGNFVIGDFTYLEVIQDGVCLGKIYPCKRDSDNVLGLYNTVTNQFLTNLGTGTLTADIFATPSPSEPINIVCNNGVLKWDSVNQIVYADGTVETISVHGKNLFDKTTITANRYVNSSGVVTSDGTNQSVVSDKIYVKPNTTYTLSGMGDVYGASYGRTGYQYKADNTPITAIARTSDAPVTFTTDSECAYVIVISTNAGVDTTMLEQGSTATTYQPYFNGGTATAEMLLSVGTYTDEQEVIAGNVTRKVGVKVLDGTEAWASILYPQTNAYRISWAGATAALGTIRYSGVWCTHFEDGGSASTAEPNKTFFANDLNINFPKISDFDTRDKCVQWLADQYAAGTPVIIVYPLATATTESVTGQTLQVTDGDNIAEITQASLTGLELEVQYSAAVSLTIQEVQDANLDPNVQVTIN